MEAKQMAEVDMVMWVPSLVSGGALGLVWMGIRTGSKKQDDKMDKIEKKQEKFLTKDEHHTLCQNSTLRLEKHVSEEIQKVLIELRKMNRET